jgi:hypothetical protein
MNDELKPLNNQQNQAVYPLILRFISLPSVSPVFVLQQSELNVPIFGINDYGNWKRIGRPNS